MNRLITLIGLCLMLAAPLARSQGTAFSYEGHLNVGGSPANGNYDMTFALYINPAPLPPPATNMPIAGPLTVSGIGVTNGLFNTILDFGNAYGTESIWLEIAVRSSGGGSYTTLAPRQPILPTPYAVTAQNVTGNNILLQQIANIGRVPLLDEGNQDFISRDENDNYAIEGDSFGIGVIGNSFEAKDGVLGESSGGNGVEGYTVGGGSYGVYGHNDAGVGVFGYSAGSGAGVFGSSASGVGGSFTGGTAAIVANGMVRLNDNNIYLRAGPDTNHGIGYYYGSKSFAGNTTIDGPVLFGFNSGVLGTEKFGTEHIALQWDSGSVSVYGTFNNLSDRNAKERFANVNPAKILAEVMRLPVSEWSYKTDPGTRHIGPVAQDFYSTFDIGTDEKHIAPIDEGGVALAAIQALNQKVEEKNRKIGELETRLEKLEQVIKNGGNK
jgi:hypothetical protein